MSYLVQFAIPITVDDGPHPINVVGHLCIDTKFIALGATISKGSNAKNGPRMISLCGIPTE